MTVTAEFTTLKELIMQVLRDYPETRIWKTLFMN